MQTIFAALASCSRRGSEIVVSRCRVTFAIRECASRRLPGGGSVAKSLAISVSGWGGAAPLIGDRSCKPKIVAKYLLDAGRQVNRLLLTVNLRLRVDVKVLGWGRR